jgi:site-specific DNA-methyltransferase (adenine-specific)
VTSVKYDAFAREKVSPRGAPCEAPREHAGTANPYVQGVITVHHADNLKFLATLPDGVVDLIYIDPPFNTGHPQRRTRIRTRTARPGATGDRTGFGGRRFDSTVLGSHAFDDSFDDYVGFLDPRLREARRVLAPDGSLFVHLDPREVHYVKVHLDGLFGRASFMNEIIWAYDYGARSTRRWASKHDTILWYAKDPVRYTYRPSESDRLPYMAPGLVTAEKRARGKLPTDTWWHTIVSPTGKEKTGYPTQKPLAILERIVKVHSRPGDRLLDFFAGSGSFGDAADRHGRDVTLVDSNPSAIRVMKKRFAVREVRWGASRG